jgi:hypothetical protein
MTTTAQPSFLNARNYKYQNDDDSSNFEPKYIHIGSMHLLASAETLIVRLYRYYTEREQLRVVADFGGGEYMDFSDDQRLDFSLLLSACAFMNCAYDSARGQGITVRLMNIFYTERTERSYEITKKDHLEKIKLLSWSDLIEDLQWRSMSITFECIAPQV